MKSAAAAILLAALAAASPAHATQGLLCSPVAGAGPSVSVVIGAGPGIAGVSLREAGGDWRHADGSGIAIGQSWLDRERLWIDIVDASAIDVVARVRVTRSGNGSFAGTLEHRGRTHRVRCVED
jgi:hypothetical protein